MAGKFHDLDKTFIFMIFLNIGLGKQIDFQKSNKQLYLFYYKISDNVYFIKGEKKEKNNYVAAYLYIYNYKHFVQVVEFTRHEGI